MREGEEMWEGEEMREKEEMWEEEREDCERKRKVEIPGL
jgi:hypothetical protein